MAISDRGGSVCPKCGGHTGSMPSNTSDWDWRGSAPCDCGVKTPKKDSAFKGLSNMTGSKSMRDRMYS